MFRCALAALSLLVPFAAEAAAPGLIPVTGYLTDSGGAPINAQVTLDLRLYADATGGSFLWEEIQQVDVDHGQFTAYLGAQNSLDLALFADHPAVFLGMSVDTGVEMSPRFTVATAPYAAYAQYCDDAATVGGVDPADIALSSDTVAWTRLTGVPADLADGDQDTTYTSGVGLNLSAQHQFSADQAAIEAWARGVAYDTPGELRTQLDSVYAAKQACSTGQVLAADASGSWACTDPTTLPISEAFVDSAVANNGYAAASDLVALTSRVSTAEAAITSLNAKLSVYGGTAADDAAPSCLAIKNAHPTAADGTYWLNPYNSDPSLSFKAYCLMSRAGGGWTKVAQYDNITDLSPMNGVNMNGAWTAGTTGAGKLPNAAISLMWTRTRFMLRMANPSDGLLFGNGVGYMIFAGHFTDFGVPLRPGTPPYTLYCEQTGDEIVDAIQSYSPDGRADCAYGSYWLYDHNYTGDPQCYGFSNTKFTANLHFCGTTSTRAAGGVSGITQVYVRD